MGRGSSCYYSSYGAYYNGCNSYPNGSVLTAGAIVGIVIGCLVALAIVILLVLLSCRLLKRRNLSLGQSYYPNVYSVPTNTNNRQQPERRSEMYIPPKSPMYSEEPMNNRFYNNV